MATTTAVGAHSGPFAAARQAIIIATHRQVDVPFSLSNHHLCHTTHQTRAQDGLQRRVPEPPRPPSLRVRVKHECSVVTFVSDIRHLLRSHMHPHPRKSLESTRSYQQQDDAASFQEGPVMPLPQPQLPDLDLPQSELDLTTTFESILAESIAVEETIAKAEPE